MPLLADFGVARPTLEAGQTTLTGTGLQVGTLDYMAPEQLTGGREVDTRADLYALGVVAFEMLAGRQPFQQVCDRFGERRPSVRAFVPEVPESVDLAIRPRARGRSR